MNVTEAIEKMLEISKMRKATLASRLGRSRQSVYNMFRQNPDLKTSTLLSMARVMGFQVVLRREGSPDIVIDAVDPRSLEEQDETLGR